MNPVSFWLRTCLLGGLLAFLPFSLLLAQTVDPDYLDGQVYVKLTAATSEVIPSPAQVPSDETWSDLVPLIQQYGITTIERPFLMLKTPVFDRTYRFRFSQAQQAQALVSALAQLPQVEYAERVPLMRPSVIPNDPSWSLQAAHLLNIDAHLGWDIHTGTDVTVAIVDDAVQATHPDLSPNMWVNPGEIPGNGLDDDNNGYVDDVNGYDVSDLDPNVNPPATAGPFDFSHGTHCAGIAGAATDNGVGIASIGHTCQIIGVKASPDTSSQFIYNAYDGVVYAIAAGADIISMSWGGGSFSTTAQNIFNQANAQGTLLVAAAGNDNTAIQMYPAAYNHVIAVANLTDADIRNGSSNYGGWVDISAPGTDIYSTVAQSSYVNYTGTSMACPQVAGLLSLMKSYRPTLSSAELEAYLLAAAENVDDLNPFYSGDLGTGRINVHHSLLAMDYCLSAATFAVDSRIDAFSLSNVVNSTTNVCETYRIFPDQVAELVPGTNAPLSLTLGSCGGDYNKGAKVFVDWNNDGDFGDPGEEVFSTGLAAATTTYTGSISVPATLTNSDTLRLRIVCQEAGSMASIDACGGYNYGETQDYFVTAAPPLCTGTLVNTFPYQEDFESFTLCSTTSGSACALPVSSGWTNGSNDDIDWTVDQGGTPSIGTGPAQDSVPGSSVGHYLYTEATLAGTGHPNMEALLESPCFDLSGLSLATLSFAYHMYGSDMGTLTVLVNDGSGWQSVWSLSGDQGNVWSLATVDLSAYVGDTLKLRFRGITGSDFRSDMAIDHVRVFEPVSCSGTTTFTTLAGTFDDGSGPGDYSDNVDCYWHIDLPSIANSITLDFTAMDVQPGDQVRVYDGATTAAPLLGTFTGSTLPGSLTSSSRDLLLRFTTDGSGSSAGWAVDYQANVSADVVYGYNAADPTGQLPQGPVVFELASPDSIYLLADQSALSFLNGGCWVNGIWYAISYSDTTLVTVNPNTGDRTTVGPLGFGDRLHGMAFDHTTQTLYGVDFSGGLYIVNPATGAATLVGSDPANQLYINLACNAAGQLYAVDIASDQLYSIDKATGMGTAIGSIGFDANFAQDMEFDPNTGTLYMASYGLTEPGILRTVNPATGATTMVDTFMNEIELTAFAIPGQNSLPPACSGLTTLTAPSGTFDDGSGAGANYGNNSSCTWLIQPANAVSIDVSFNTFATELTTDVVNIYDGSSASAPLLGSFSGGVLPGPLTASSGSVFVEFLTDSANTDLGWEITYQATINSNVLTYVGGQASGAVGTVVSFPVRMTNFIDLVSFQGSMSISDPSVGQFVSGSAGNFHPSLMGLGAGSFNITSDTVSFSWNHPLLTPTTLPNNAVAFTIDVQLTGSMGDVADVCFGDSPTLREAASFDGVNFTVLTPDTLCGSVEILDEVAISGLIHTETMQPLNQATVDLSGSSTSSMVTSLNGQYSFANLPAGGSFSVTPSKDLDPSNGVSTFDIVLMRQHILGIAALPSPYKIIAADVNASASVTTLDVVFMRQLILGTTTSFASVPSWRTVPSSYVFPNPSNPFMPAYPESLSYSALLADSVNQDFIAIKMGDVTGNATNLRIGRTEGTLTLAMLERDLQADEVIEVPVTVRDFHQVLGYQFTVDFDPKVLRYEGWHRSDLADLGEEHFNLHRSGEGKLTTSWDDPQSQGVSLPDDAVLFTLRFAVQVGDARLSEAFAINSALTPQEAYRADLAQLAIESQFIDPADPVYGFALFQNKPNPFAGTTTIGYRLPVATPATLTVTDAMGRMLLSLPLDGARGYNEVTLEQADQWAEGVYYYRLITADGFQAARPMQLRD